MRASRADCRCSIASVGLPRRYSASDAYACPSCHSHVPFSASCNVRLSARVYRSTGRHLPQTCRMLDIQRASPSLIKGHLKKETSWLFWRDFKRCRTVSHSEHRRKWKHDIMSCHSSIDESALRQIIAMDVIMVEVKFLRQGCPRQAAMQMLRDSAVDTEKCKCRVHCICLPCCFPAPTNACFSAEMILQPLPGSLPSHLLPCTMPRIQCCHCANFSIVDLSHDLQACKRAKMQWGGVHSPFERRITFLSIRRTYLEDRRCGCWLLERGSTVNQRT